MLGIAQIRRPRKIFVLGALVALVGMNGSIDWYCYSHFDSPSVFGAILDDKNGGDFRISADSDGAQHKQFYWPSTNVLVTGFLLTDGIAELEDFMPLGLPSDSAEYRHIYRLFGW